VRVGDADRHQAISDLGAHFADGRLSVTEYDERCHAASTAANRAELDKLFIDLPSLPRDQSSTETVLYSAAEVSALHRRGGNFRAGIMALTAVLSVTAASLIQNDFSVIVLAAIPVVAILLYVMKVGPVQWYAPSRTGWNWKSTGHGVSSRKRRSPVTLSTSLIERWGRRGVDRNAGVNSEL